MKTRKSYAEREYGVTKPQLIRFQKRVTRQIARKSGSLVEFTGNIEDLVAKSGKLC